jgi:hypothetical protein
MSYGYANVPQEQMAKAQAYQKEQYEGARVPTPGGAVMMEIITQQAKNIERSRVAENRLNTILDRLRGSRPQEAQKDQAQHSPNGSLDALRTAAAWQSDSIEHIHTLLGELDKLI